jgi:hypothetical protein
MNEFRGRIGGEGTGGVKKIGSLTISSQLDCTVEL